MDIHPNIVEQIDTRGGFLTMVNEAAHDDRCARALLESLFLACLREKNQQLFYNTFRDIAEAYAEEAAL